MAAAMVIVKMTMKYDNENDHGGGGSAGDGSRG